MASIGASLGGVLPPARHTADLRRDANLNTGVARSERRGDRRRGDGVHVRLRTLRSVRGCSGRSFQPQVDGRVWRVRLLPRDLRLRLRCVAWANGRLVRNPQRLRTVVLLPFRDVDHRRASQGDSRNGAVHTADGAICRHNRVQRGIRMACGVRRRRLACAVQGVRRHRHTLGRRDGFWVEEWGTEV